MMMFVIREAGMADADMLRKLSTETFVETYAAKNTAENMDLYILSEFNKQAIEQELSDPGCRFYVALNDDELVGYAKVSFHKQREELSNKRQMEIERLYVYKRYQKQKAGYQLINKCLDIARELGCDAIWLGVWEENAGAISFYERVGFRQFGRHIFQLGNDPQKDLLFQIQL